MSGLPGDREPGEDIEVVLPLTMYIIENKLHIYCFALTQCIYMCYSIQFIPQPTYTEHSDTT